MQNAATTAVSGSEALIAAITGGIARRPTMTSWFDARPSSTAIALARSIAISAGPDSSWRPARLGGGATSSRSLTGMCLIVNR